MAGEEVSELRQHPGGGPAVPTVTPAQGGTDVRTRPWSQRGAALALSSRRVSLRRGGRGSGTSSRPREIPRRHTCPMTSPASPWHPGAGPLPVIAPQGEFDYGSVPWLREQIDTAADAHGGVILDAGGITFIDSTVFTLILMTHQRTHLRVANLQPRLAQVFGVYGIDRVLNIYPTVDSARTT
ncbi:STAS domain-containing protein [Streptomyces microflavus]|uniref:STAS domain-containing protein n=2 Tax=Streptomyces microflavus subgroup TaxID=1482601 RepID=UPI003819B060